MQPVKRGVKYVPLFFRRASSQACWTIRLIATKEVLMKFNFFSTWVCLLALLCLTSTGNAALNAVNVGPDGITFPDNSVQSKAAVLPTCSSGGVLVNNSGAWLCGTIMPIANGIATCANTICSVSACLSGSDNCDGIVANGCETLLTSTQNCGGCGIVCAVSETCNSGVCFNPNKPASINLSATPTSGGVNNIGPVTLTATVTPEVNGTIANGTTVTFIIQSGTGTLSSTTASTTNGIATVILNSTVVGSVSVNATAGSAPLVTSNTVSVPFVTQPTLAIVKLATNGTLPGGTLIGGVQVIVTANPSAGLTIQASDVTASGVAVGSIMIANTINIAAVNLAPITTSGFTTGEFATLNYHVANGTFPLAGSFGLTPISVIDTFGDPIAGIGFTIQSVTIQ